MLSKKIKKSLIKVVAILNIITISAMMTAGCGLTDNLKENSASDNKDNTGGIAEESITTTELHTESIIMTVPPTELITEQQTEPTTINPLVLQKGDKGSDVENLQAKLRDIGVYTGNIDGDFGPMTESAVIKLQENYNIPQDGIVQGEMWITLDNALKSTVTSDEPQTEQPQELQAATSNNTSKPSVDSKNVEELTKYLRSTFGSKINTAAGAISIKYAVSRPDSFSALGDINDLEVVIVDESLFYLLTIQDLADSRDKTEREKALKADKQVYEFVKKVSSHLAELFPDEKIKGWFGTLGGSYDASANKIKDYGDTALYEIKPGGYVSATKFYEWQNYKDTHYYSNYHMILLNYMIDLENNSPYYKKISEYTDEMLKSKPHAESTRELYDLVPAEPDIHFTGSKTSLSTAKGATIIYDDGGIGFNHGYGNYYLPDFSMEIALKGTYSKQVEVSDLRVVYTTLYDEYDSFEVVANIKNNSNTKLNVTVDADIYLGGEKVEHVILIALGLNSGESKEVRAPAVKLSERQSYDVKLSDSGIIAMASP